MTSHSCWQVLERRGVYVLVVVFLFKDKLCGDSAWIAIAHLGRMTRNNGKLSGNKMNGCEINTKEGGNWKNIRCQCVLRHSLVNRGACIFQACIFQAKTWSCRIWWGLKVLLKQLNTLVWTCWQRCYCTNDHILQ